MLSRKSLEGVDLRALWTAVDRERRISMLSLSTPRIDADWAEASIAICLSFSPTRSHRPAPKPSGPPWPPWPPIVIATATHMLPEITLWRGRRSHILLSTWVPEMGFLLSECELQAILLIHERYVTLFINSVTYRSQAVGGVAKYYMYRTAAVGRVKFYQYMYK